MMGALGTVAVQTLFEFEDDETIKRSAARTYFEQYFGEVVRSPEVTWNLITSEYKRARKRTYEQYVAYWSQFIEVRPSGYIENSGSDNRFDVILTYRHKDGPPDHQERIAYWLTCDSWKNYVKVIHCTSDNLRIDDGMIVQLTLG